MPEQDTFLADLDASYAASQKAAPEAAPEAAPDGVGDFVKDTGRALVGGVESAVIGARQTVRGIGKAILPQDMIDTLAPEMNEELQPSIVSNPKYTFNKIAKDITQYGIGFLAGGPVLKGAGLAAKGAAGLIGQSAVGTGLVADAHSERLSNLVQQYPFLENPLTSYLASDPNDGVIAGKFKAALEDAFTTPVALGLFKAIQYGIKSTRGLLKPGSKEALEAETDLAQTMTLLNEAGEQGTLKAEKYAGNIASDEELLALNQVKNNQPLKDATQKVIGEKYGDTGAGFRAAKHEELQSILKTGKFQHGDNPEGISAQLIGKKSTAIYHEGDGIVVRGDSLKPSGRVGESHINPDADPKTATFMLGGKEHSFEEAQQYFAGASKTLSKTQTKAGGPEALQTLAAKSFKGREAFNLTPEQYTQFERDMLHNVGAGEMNDLYTKSLPEGAFNYAKMENRGDVHATLQSLAEVIAPQLDKTMKQGTMSFAEMQRTASLFGSKPDVMMANLRSWGVDAKSIPATFLAAKNWSQSLANEIFRDARSIAIMGSGGESAKLEMMRKVTVLADLEGMMKSVQTAAARTTAAGRIRTAPRYSGADMMTMLDEFGGASKVAKLAEKLAMTEGDPNKIAKMLRVSWQRKVLDTHNELWINSILSGISTHVVNTSTAGVNAFLKPGNMAMGGLIRGDMESVRAGLSAWKGMGSAMKDSFSMARKAFDMERPILSASDKQLEIESTISAGNYNLNPESWMGQGVNWLGKAARLPSRFLGAEDEFWKQMSYRAKLNQSATSESVKLIRAGQLDPNKMVDLLVDGKTVKVSEVDAWVQNKFNEGFNYEVVPEFGPKPTQMGGTDRASLQFANEATFTQSLKIPTWLGNDSFAQTMYRAANSHPMLRGTVLPFIKVPANLLREAAGYTPGINLLRKQFWADMAEGGERASEAIGKMATGSMLMSGATYLAVEGKITGGAPTDPDIRNRMYEKNWQPYSFVFENQDGTKTYVPFARFDPWGLVFGVVGDIAQTFQHVSEESRHSFAASATMAVANMLNSRSYLKGMVDALDVVSGGQGQDGVDKFIRIMNQRAASYIPNVVRVAQPDTEIKEIRSMMDAMMAKLPGFSEGVPAKRGYFGDKVMAPIGWPWHAILPSRIGQETTDSALLELARLSDGPAQAHFKNPEKRVGTLDLTKFPNIEGVTAYDRMMEKLSETDFHDKLNDLVQDDRYKAGTDGDAFYPGSKVTMIKRLESKYHKQALDETLKEFQAQATTLGYDLREMYRADRKNARASKQGRDVTELDRLLELNQ